jgi:hypothetical protein
MKVEANKYRESEISVPIDNPAHFLFSSLQYWWTQNQKMSPSIAATESSTVLVDLPRIYKILKIVVHNEENSYLTKEANRQHKKY